jgi:hypothetical protein
VKAMQSRGFWAAASAQGASDGAGMTVFCWCKSDDIVRGAIVTG